MTWRKMALVLVLTAVCGRVAAQETDVGPPEKLHVYLLIGQSNMAGRAPFTEAEAAPIQRVYLLDDHDAWVPATNPLNRYSTIRKQLDMQKMNPGYTFSRAMAAADDTVAIGLVVNAMGGTAIQSWVKGTHFYKEAVRRTQLAARTGTLKGILWHQGETNIRKPDGYLEALAGLVRDLRADLDAPDLPFVAGQVNDVPVINEQIAKLPATVPGTAFVSSAGLVAMDRWHFDAPSMRLLGVRYAMAMQALQASGTDPAVRGAQRARRDIAGGVMKILYFGKPWSVGKPLVDDDSGLPVTVVAGCVVTPEFVAETTAYNATMRAAAMQAGDGQRP